MRIGHFLAVIAACGAPALAAPPCGGGGVTLSLLRNGDVTQLSPTLPPVRTILSGLPSDPTLAPVRDLEARGFVSGAAFAHDASDLAPGHPLVFYQLTTPTRVLHVAKTGGRLVLTYATDAAQAITFPAPGGGAMLGGARSGLLLRRDGTVLDWGADFGTKLGQGNAVAADQYAPVQVHGPLDAGFLSDVQAIAAGEPFNAALMTDGTVWTWGDNGAFGELGIGDPTVASSSVPVQVTGVGGTGCLTGITGIAARGYHALALDEQGRVFGWGRNIQGECGDGTASNEQDAPVQVQGLPATPIVQVNCAMGYSLALDATGLVWGWGANARGELADGTFDSPKLVPQRVGQTIGLADVVQVSAGWAHGLALQADGTVWAWGGNGYGEVGDGTTTNADVPHQVPGPGGIGVLSSIVMVSGGDCSSAALRSDGTVWTWGCNHHNGYNPPPAGQDPVGQLGNGDDTYQDQPYPVQVVGGEQGGAFLHDIVLISARDYHDYALASDGTLYAWGSNLNGQLGTGSCCLPSTVPVRVHLP